jgi:putative ABC transport system permease protein
MAISVTTQQEFLNRNGGQMAGFDIHATTTLPIQDLRAAIQDHPELRATDYEAFGWAASLPAESRRVGAGASNWTERYPLVAVDEGFIQQVQPVYPLAMRATGYATDQDVWRVLSERDDVVVVPPRMALPPPMSLEVREANVPDAAAARFEVIAVLASETTAAGSGMLANPRAVERLTGSPAKPAIHFMKLHSGVDAQAAARQMEQAFQVYGMDARTAENVNPVVREVAASLTTLQGFVALGLLVGLAAPGVISSRNVVERRQQIGVLRALGFQPGMVALSFMLESGFVSFLGILIGVGLGIVLSLNMVAGAGRGESGLTVTLPWVQIVAITLAACAFSLVTTIIPAYQAARIRPAAALRYE